VEHERDRTIDTISYKDLVDEFSTFFVAGMDTTGHWMGIALYMLTIVSTYY
jgi:cytochrome P450